MADGAKRMGGGKWDRPVLLSGPWGGALFFAGVAAGELPPMTVVLARVARAAAMPLSPFWHLGHRLPRRRSRDTTLQYPSQASGITS